MMAAEPVVWGIHGGRTGDVDPLFLKQGYIALGWPEMGDLRQVPKDREAFKTRAADCYPDAKPGAIPVYAGQLYRFLYEVKPNDLVVYPSKRDSQVHLGRVTGDYRYSPCVNQQYPHLRPIRWLKAIPRTQFSQGALYEIGASMSFFHVKNYGDEFRAALEGQAVPPPVEKDETVALVADEIEQTTRDFILKRLAQELKGHPLAGFMAHLLGAMGYRTRVSPEGPDGGVDIVAHRDELGFEPPIIKVQVKGAEGSVGDPVVSALYGKVAPGEFGLIVTLGRFTPAARNFARSKSNLRLIDGQELIDLVLHHYEQFDSAYKALLPLKQVYVPEVLPETGP